MRHSYQIGDFPWDAFACGIFGPRAQKPLHEETEQYILVAANINLEYWQEVGGRF